jgi:hypothetical protein
MSEREDFIGAWVSEKEKREVAELAKGMNISVSDLIRHRVIRPMMTLPEAIQNLKLYIDSRLNKIEHNITEVLKKQLFAREPIRRTYIEEYDKPITHPKPSVIISSSSQLLRMKNVLAEMEKLVKNGELILETVPKEEVERKRAKTDPLAYLEFKTKKKN